MEWNMPLCFVILILCYNVHILGASYAYITVNPTEIQLGVNLTMSCTYNGSFTVSSIVWEKNSAGVQIRLFTNCIAAYTPDSTVYNMNRTTYSCDQVNNIYNLTLKNLVTEDDGNSWSCSLRLSPGNSTDLVVYTIRLPYSTTTRTSTVTPISTTRIKYVDIGTTLSITTTTSRTLPVIIIIGISVGGFLFIILLLIVCCCCCKCCWFYRCRKNANTDKYEANDRGNFNNDSIAIDGTSNAAYALSNTSRVSSNSNEFK
ncbi:hypothetical protein ACJMK2_011797 [Sinanodonta woodiana]|uniref:Ig-like domain-containing protein n=1 Tax=Sinanodonta woodiana TaxID=1069815 RepID=A0ABD3V7U2_SINWO